MHDDTMVRDVRRHNPTIARANDGTYLLFTIGNTPLVQSRSLDGPWQAVKGFKNRTFNCNNPAPVVAPGRDEVYVFLGDVHVRPTTCRQCTGAFAVCVCGLLYVFLA